MPTSVKMKFDKYELVVDPTQLGGAATIFRYIAPAPGDKTVKSGLLFATQNARNGNVNLVGYYAPTEDTDKMVVELSKVNYFANYAGTTIEGTVVSDKPSLDSLKLSLGDDIEKGQNREFYQQYAGDFFKQIISVLKRNKLLAEAAAMVTLSPRVAPNATAADGYLIPAGVVEMIKNFGGEAQVNIILKSELESIKAKNEELGGKKEIPALKDESAKKEDEKKSDSGGGATPPAPQEPDASKAREKIGTRLDDVLDDDLDINAFKEPLVAAAVEASTFDEGDLHDELKEIHEKMKSGESLDIPASIKDLPGWESANDVEEIANETVLEKLQEEFPKSFEDFVKENPEIKDLLKIGSTDSSKLNPENKTTYENLEKYAKMLGVEEEFKAIAQGKPYQGKKTRKSRDVADDEEESSSDGSDGRTDSRASRDSSDQADERRKGDSDAKRADEPVKRKERIALRFQIDGTYKGDDEDAEKAIVKYKFLSDEGAASDLLTAKIEKAHSGTFSLPWEEKYETFNRISVSVTATTTQPDGVPGPEETMSEVYPIPERGVPVGRVAVFNFSQKVSGERDLKGLRISGGFRSVEDKPDVSGDVVDYYYDKSGRAKVIRGVDAKCAKRGKEYTFTFTPNKPLIIPIKTSTNMTMVPGMINETKRAVGLISEATLPTAVPHWIFLNKNMKGRGAQGGDGGGAGGGNLGDAGPYNVAVIKIVCKTDDSWAQIPQDDSMWVRKTLEITLAPKSNFTIKGAAPILFAGSVDQDEIQSQMEEFILGASEIWRMSGLDGWIEHMSVTGPRGITVRRWTQSPAARPG